MRNVIKISAEAGLINDIISQVNVVNQEEKKQIEFLGRNEFSMIGMEYRTNPDQSGGSTTDLIIEAENPMLFYKLGLYTAPLIKKIFK